MKSQRRRGRRPPGGGNRLTQIASIVFLIGMLIFVLRFKDTLARSLSGLFSAFGAGSDIETTSDEGLDTPPGPGPAPAQEDAAGPASSDATHDDHQESP